MRESGMVRNLDNVGRLVIPKEIRKVLGIKEGEPLEILKVNNEIVVKKYSRGCIFCGSEKDILRYKAVLVCGECKRNLGQE